LYGHHVFVKSKFCIEEAENGKKFFFWSFKDRNILWFKQST